MILFFSKNVESFLSKYESKKRRPSNLPLQSYKVKYKFDVSGPHVIRYISFLVSLPNIAESDFIEKLLNESQISNATIDR